jgi:predicted RNase H-like HicB family nuclease
VLDGATVARALERLEQVLRGTITTELTRQSLRPAAAPAAAA